MATTVIEPAFLRRREVADYLGVSPSQLARYEKLDNFPKPVRYGLGKRVGFVFKEIKAYANGLVAARDGVMPGAQPEKSRAMKQRLTPKGQARDAA